MSEEKASFYKFEVGGRGLRGRKPLCGGKI